MVVSAFIPKLTGYYFFFTSTIETTILIPISYFLALTLMPSCSQLKISLVAASIISSFSLGKLISQTLVLKLSQSRSLKAILLVLQFSSSIGILFFGIFSALPCLFFSRILSGISSNSQILIRKLLFNFAIKEKQDLQKASNSLLILSKLGGISGIFLAGALSNFFSILNKSTDALNEQWILLSLVLFIIDILGIFLVLSADAASLEIFSKEKYSEMTEKSDGRNRDLNITAEEGKTDDRPADPFSFKHFTEEKTEKEVEEVKYFSPKHISNKSSVLKLPMSARPHLNSRESADTVEDPRFSNLVKKTHISIIEEDLEVPNPSQSPESGSEPPIDASEPSLKFASMLRVYLSFVLNLIPESIQYIYVYLYPSIGVGKISLLIFLSYLISFLSRQILANTLLQRVPYSELVKWFCKFSVILLAITSTAILVNPGPYIICVICSLLLLSNDFISPFGAILISDSVGLSERDLAFEKSNTFCIVSKIFSNFVPPIFIFFIHPSSFYVFSIFGYLCIIYLTNLSKLKYKYINTSPYII